MGRRGHRVDIYTRLIDPLCQRVTDLYENVRLIHLKAGPIGYLPKSDLYPYLTEFCHELERFRVCQRLHYDLAHSHYWLSGHVGSYTREQWHIPHVVTFHTLGAVKNATAGVEREPELRISAETRLVKTCDRVVASTEEEKELLEAYYGASSDSIAVVPCGVNLGTFLPTDKTAARRSLNLGLAERVLLFVGRFAPSKGADRLLEAVSHLREHPGLKLIMVGGDGRQSPEAQNLKKLSTDWGVEDAVIFAGSVEQDRLPTYYNAADLLVIPSRYESFGLVALESLACGTPVVTTRVGAMPSILQEGRTGHIVQNGSPRLLTEGIAGLLAGSNIPSAEAIRSSVLNFGWDRIAAAMLDQYTLAIQTQ
jgi:D-inositol-3-phosphate glycosyltransferase